MLTKKIKRFAAILTVSVTICLMPLTIFANYESRSSGIEVETVNIEVNLSNNESLPTTLCLNERQASFIINEFAKLYLKTDGLQTTRAYQAIMSKIDREVADLGHGKVLKDGTSIRRAPSMRYSPVGFLNKDDDVYIIAKTTMWYKIVSGNEIGYVHIDSIELIQNQNHTQEEQHPHFILKTGSLLTTRVEPTFIVDYKEQQELEFGEHILNTAQKYIGTPYVSGGTSPNGFDCSGFVYYVYNKVGYPLPRMISDQYKAGKPVTKNELKPGDILIFQNTNGHGMSHVGIYAGNGQFIHSPRTGKTVTYADLYSEYWIKHYYGAVRIANN